MPVMTTEEAYFTLAPDWACEVLSPSTLVKDRARKLPIYAAHGVAHVWLIDPVQRLLEVLRLEGGRYSIASTHAGAERVRAEPFDAIELDLAVLWADVDLSGLVQR